MPEGDHTITPYFTVSDADRLLEFLVEAFGGTIFKTNRHPNGSIQHARVRIGDSVIMLNESNQLYSANVSQMHLYVDDVEVVFSKALSAGAISVMEPNVRPHGELHGWTQRSVWKHMVDSKICWRRSVSSPHEKWKSPKNGNMKVVAMRENYDFTNSIPNPYAKRLKQQITIRID